MLIALYGLVEINIKKLFSHIGFNAQKTVHSPLYQ